MPDPNARRDKALADIASELKSISTTLDKIEKNTRKKSMTVINNPEPKSGPANPDPHTGPYGVGVPYGQ